MRGGGGGDGELVSDLRTPPSLRRRRRRRRAEAVVNSDLAARGGRYSDLRHFCDSFFAVTFFTVKSKGEVRGSPTMEDGGRRGNRG